MFLWALESIESGASHSLKKDLPTKNCQKIPLESLPDVSTILLGKNQTCLPSTSHSKVDMADPEAEGLPRGQELDAFHRLVQDLSDVLGPSSGLDSADVDLEDIERLMKAYKSNPAEWIQYAGRDPIRPYTRTLVDEGNGKSNLVSHYWTI